MAKTFNSKKRRQIFLSILLYVWAMSSFIWMVETNETSNHPRNLNENLVSVSYLCYMIGTVCALTTFCFGFKCTGKKKVLLLLIGLVLISACILSIIATIETINSDVDCSNNDECTISLFGYRGVPIGVSLIIIMDLLTNVLQNRRWRVLLFTLMLCVCAGLQIPEWYQDGCSTLYTTAEQIYHAAWIGIAICCIFLSLVLGVLGKLQLRYFNDAFATILFFVSCMMALCGCFIVLNKIHQTTFFKYHCGTYYLLCFGVTFVIMVDTITKTEEDCKSISFNNVPDVDDDEGMPHTDELEFERDESFSSISEDQPIHSTIRKKLIV